MNEKKLRVLLSLFLVFVLFTAYFSEGTAKTEAAAVTGEDVVKYASSLLNKPYAVGMQGPEKFDNWGFTKYVYQNFGITLGNSLSAQAQQGKLIKKGEPLQKGDLLFFGYSSAKLLHVGIYIGDNKFIGAYSKDKKVMTHSLTGDYNKYYLGAKRLLNSPTSSSDRDPLSAKVVAASKKYLGVPYQLGADYDRDGSYKFDCSSFTQKVFADVGISLPRTTSQQASATKRIATSDLKAGDLVFFDTNYDGKMNHVGIYLGDGKFIHASTANNRNVQITDMNSSSFWKNAYMFATRVF